MTSTQTSRVPGSPPRVGGGGGPDGPPRVGGAPRRPGNGGSGRQGGPRPSLPQPKTGSVSSRTIFVLFLLLVVLCGLSIVAIPFPLSNVKPTASTWVGAVCGAFGCSLLFGVFQFCVNQQYAVGTFSDWAFPISKMTIAKVATLIGWVGGGLNSYLLAHHFARAIA